MLGKTMIITLAASSALLLGLAAPAMAETSPAVGMPPLTEWVFSGANADPAIEFDYSGNWVGFPLATTMPAATVDAAAAHWGGIDNPAPLLWYAKHVDDNFNPQQMAGDLGQMFAKGVKYSPALIAKMNAEGFAPSMVGGYNPPGITAGTSGTSATPSPTPVASTPRTHAVASTSSTAHKVAAAPPVKKAVASASSTAKTVKTVASVATAAVSPIRSTQPTHTVPASHAPVVLAQSSTSVSTGTSSSGPLIVPPGHQSQSKTAYAAEGPHLQTDHRLLHPVPKRWGRWVWAGAALAAVLAALVAIPRILDRYRSEY